MDIIESISSYSTALSMSNIKQDMSIKILKNAMNQSEDNMMKILEMADVTGSTVDYQI